MNDAAIVGVGCTGFRSISPEVSYKELMFEAATRAYQDAGVDPRRDDPCPGAAPYPADAGDESQDFMKTKRCRKRG